MILKTIVNPEMIIKFFTNFYCVVSNIILCLWLILAIYISLDNNPPWKWYFVGFSLVAGIFFRYTMWQFEKKMSNKI